jgi:hydroxymethylglutaryl-CoA reductase (NADPH)
MSITKPKLNKAVEKFDLDGSIKQVASFDISKTEALESVPSRNPYTEEGFEKRKEFMKATTGKTFDQLSGDEEIDIYGNLPGNLENFIGMSQVPTGVLGPLVINGISASGGYYVPLATTEGALVASYARGARACRLSGAITSICLVEGIQRCPLFKFETILGVGEFILWIMKEKEKFDAVVATTSNYAKLNDMDFNIEGNQVILTFEFTTGDAAGQNMVTIATQAICAHIIKHTPIQPEIWFIESNFSGDKKATSTSFSSVRGKKVVSEITLKKEVISKILKSTPELLFQYWQTSFMGAVKCGAIGAQGHYANGLAALFIACGQDAACVSEAAVGITRMEIDKNGDLYCSVTLPNVIVGTVGGGTSWPTQRECLEMMDCYGEGKSVRLAEICASLCLAGEISIIAAMSSGEFASAHQRLGR